MALLAELVQDGDEEKNVEGDDKEDHGEDDDKEDHVEDDDTKVLNWTFMDIDDFSLTFLSPFSHLPLTIPSFPLTLLSETSQGLSTSSRGGSLATAHACRPLDITQPPDHLATGESRFFQICYMISIALI